jgi:hypothetical protein
MAAVSDAYLYRAVAAKVQDMPDGWCRIVRDSDGFVMSVQPDGSVQWKAPDTYGKYEHGIHRDNGVDYWPEDFNHPGYFFAVKEP